MEAPEDDARALASDARNKVIQTIGNLTIIMQSLNTAQSNAARKDKRVEHMKHSLLPLNQMLNDFQVWDEGTIALRAERLFAKALEIWPRG